MSFGPVTIVGPGRMGLALGQALLDAGDTDALTYFGRHPSPPGHPLFAGGRARYVFGVEALSADSEVLLLAVPDDAVAEVAHALASTGPAPQRCSAFHMSAAMPSDVLAPLHEAGYPVGVFHPLQAVSDPLAGAARLRGGHVFVEGGPEAATVGRRLADAMGAHALVVPATRRPVRHAATVMATSYLMPLLELSTRLLERSGVDAEEAVPALIAMVRGVLASVEEGGLPAALSGPIADGDVEAVATHLRALDPEDARLYAFVGSEVLRIAGPRVGPEQAAALDELFDRHLGLAPAPTGS